MFPEYPNKLLCPHHLWYQSTVGGMNIRDIVKVVSEKECHSCNVKWDRTLIVGGASSKK